MEGFDGGVGCDPGPRFERIETMIGALMDLIKAQGERQDALEKVVFEDFLGGLAKEGERQYMGKLGGTIREKYPTLERFNGPFKQIWKKDVYEDALERFVMPKMRASKYDESKLDEIMQEVMALLKDRFGGLVPDEEAPAAVEIEMEAGPAEIVEETDDLSGVSPKTAEWLRKERSAKGRK